MAWKDLLRNLRASGKEAPDARVDPARQGGDIPGQAPTMRPPPGAGSSQSLDRGPSKGAPIDRSVSPPDQSSSPEGPLPGMAVRRKGDPLHRPDRIVRANRQDTAYREKSFAVEFVEEHYQPFGQQVAASVLVYALQPGGIQRLATRLLGDSTNNEAQDHDAILQFLREQGVEAFCSLLGIRPGGPASGGIQGAAGQDSIPRPTPQPRKLPAARKSDEPTEGTSLRIKLEGDQFRPVRIGSDAQRRGALGKDPAESDLDLPEREEAPASSGAAEHRPATPAPTPPAAPLSPASANKGTAAAPDKRPPLRPEQTQTSPGGIRIPGGYPALWGRRPRGLGDADTQELGPPPGSSLPAPTPSPDASAESPANEYLRKIIDEHTRELLSPHKDSEESKE